VFFWAKLTGPPGGGPWGGRLPPGPFSPQSKFPPKSGGVPGFRLGFPVEQQNPGLFFFFCGCKGTGYVFLTPLFPSFGPVPTQKFFLPYFIFCGGSNNPFWTVGDKTNLAGATSPQNLKSARGKSKGLWDPPGAFRGLPLGEKTTSLWTLDKTH